MTEFPRHGVIVAATPLGNIQDASPRLCEALRKADIIAAEDTRRTRALCSALAVEPQGKIISNFDHNEDSRVEFLLDAARTGTVLIVTDAGMPLVSDPGHSLVAAAHDAEVPVTCVPGPSAVTTALALSGLNVGRFAFDGFAPRKSGPRRRWLESLATESRAVCFFESPHRLEETLLCAIEVLGENRRAAVCREMTKTYEETVRGTLGELAQWAAAGVKGEVSVVLEGASSSEIPVDLEGLLTEVERRVEAGERLKTVTKLLSKTVGISAHELYDAALERRS